MASVCAEVRSAAIEKDEQIAAMDDALRYFIRYHNDGIGQLTHAIAFAESALTPDDGKRVVDVVYAEEQLESAGRMNWLLPWKKRRSCDVLFDTGCDETPIVFPFTVWDRHEDDGLLHEYECRMPKRFAFGDENGRALKHKQDRYIAAMILVETRGEDHIYLYFDEANDVPTGRSMMGLDELATLLGDDG